MLEKLILKNFRGFSNHTIPFRATTIAVGRNNAGKSTIVQALRLLSLVVNRAEHLTFYETPKWLDIPVGYRGVSPSLKGIDFEFPSVCHGLGDPPAVITAIFSSGDHVSIYLDPETESIFAVFSDKHQTRATSRATVSNLSLPRVEILPPVGPLSVHEKLLMPEYVRASLTTNLAPQHFRNQLWIFKSQYFEENDYFAAFQARAAETWPGLRIDGIESAKSEEGKELSLFVRDGRFVAEIGWMGHGLQTWLQTIWFLVRVQPNSVIILDEPDVYLHADLQRKLLSLLKGRYKQIIVATHSIEIMAEVAADDILVVDKKSKSSKFATSIPAVQKVVEEVGAIHNLQLSRFWSARRCLFVEGNDLSVLKILQEKLSPDTSDPVDALPNLSIGGSGNWRLALGASMGFTNAAGEPIKTYCILDRDYKTDDEVHEIVNGARAQGLQIHIWRRKEIENYVLIPAAIQRYIASNVVGSKKPPTIDVVTQRLEKICNDHENDIVDNVATAILDRDRGKGVKHANTVAREWVKKSWNSLEGKVCLVPGKTAISELSGWSKGNYGVSFGANTIARTLLGSEIDSEIVAVIGTIEKRADFPLEQPAIDSSSGSGTST